MFDVIIEAIAEYPYVGVAIVFLLCGMGLPLPEEVVLIAGGYVCATFPDKAKLPWMMLWCSGAILAGDLIPFVLGRVFGTRLLRVRWLRLAVRKRSLAKFDRWFRRRGDLVIFVARFLAGIRVVAFFTAGTMKMRWGRFLLLDSLGIILIVPVLVYVGWHGAAVIDNVIDWIATVERGILWATVAGVATLAVWIWARRRRVIRRRPRVAAETFVEPRVPPRAPEEVADEEEGEEPLAEPTIGDAAPCPEPGDAPPAP